MSRKNRLSPAGRLRCRDAGRRNLERWRAKQAPAASIEQRIEKIGSQLFAELGPNPSATKLALAEGAVASLGSILIASKKIRNPKVKLEWLGVLLDALTRAQGVLQRTLKAIGISTPVTDSDGDVGEEMAKIEAEIIAKRSPKASEESEGARVEAAKDPASGHR